MTRLAVKDVYYKMPMEDRRERAEAEKMGRAFMMQAGHLGRRWETEGLDTEHLETAAQF